MPEVADKVRTFIMRASRLRELGDDEEIIQRGVVNSLLLAQLLAFLEQELGAELSDEDLNPEHFRSVSSIARLIEAKGGARDSR